MRTPTLTIACCLAALTCGAQEVPRDPRAVQNRTAIVSGTVVTGDADPRPVRHARVMLSGADSNAGLTAITDDGGRVVFQGLPSGRFDVSVTKDGWIPSSYGAKRPLGPGSTLPVAEGQHVTVMIRMWRGAAIGGIVLDHNGQPAVGATVRALRYAVQNGERKPVAGRASATTDDRGAYRIYGLAPGDYVVGASARPDFFASDRRELRLTTEIDVRDALAGASSPPDRTVAFALTFYPGTTVSSQAGVISLQAAAEREDVDLTLQTVPTARVDGTVALPAGGAMPPGVEVSLVASGQVAFPGVPFDGYRRTGVASDGSFAFSDVAPGQYTALARSAIGGQILWASADVGVDGEDVSGLALMLTAGMTVSGDIGVEGSSPTPPNLATVRITLQPVAIGDAVTQSPSGATADSRGRFTLAGVPPGRYRLAASLPGASRWALRSAVVDGVDTLDEPFTVHPNQNVIGAIITFTDRMARLSGTLRAAGGDVLTDQTVILFPANPSLWSPQSRRIRSDRPSPDGVFTFRQLPPGEYCLAAVSDIEPGEWYDPAVLRRLAAASVRIAVAEGEDKRQDVTISSSQK